MLRCLKCGPGEKKEEEAAEAISCFWEPGRISWGWNWGYELGFYIAYKAEEGD